MSDKKLTTVPKIIQLTPRSLKQPLPNAAKPPTQIQKCAPSTTIGAAAATQLVPVQAKSAHTATQQGVYFQVVPGTVQAASTILQTQTAHPSCGSILRRTPSSISAADLQTIDLEDEESDAVPLQEIPRHVIVETQFIEKEKLSENCLRTILYHEIEVRNKAKADQLLPVRLLNELRKAVTSKGSHQSVDPRRDAVIVLSDEEDDSSSDASKYIIQLDAPSGTIFSGLSNPPLVLPPMITSPYVVSPADSQTPVQSNQANNQNLPGIREMFSQGEVMPAQHMPQMVRPVATSSLLKPMFLDGKSAMNVPMVTRVVPNLRLQEPDALTPIVRDIRSQIQSRSVQCVMPIASSDLPVIKDVSHAQIHRSKSPQVTVQSPTLPLTRRTESPLLEVRSFAAGASKTTVDQIVQTMSDSRSTASMTDPPWPARNRSVQCDIHPTYYLTHPKPDSISVAIQCELPTDSRNMSPSFCQTFEEVEFLDEFDQSCFKSYKSGLWECLLCGEVGADSTHISLHYQRHQSKSVLCFYCGRLLKTSEDLTYHEFVVHKCKKRPKRMSRLLCPYPKCMTVRWTLPDLYDHMNTHIGEKPHNCSCSRSFYSYRALQLHRLRCKCPKGRGKYPYCDLPRWKLTYKQNVHKLFKQRKTFTAKFRRRSFRTKQLYCKICFKLCTNRTQLVNHVRAVHNGSMKCKICKQYFYLPDFKDHMRAEKLLNSQRKHASPSL